MELSNWHDPDIMDATAQYHKGNLQSAFTLFLIGAERGYQNAQVNSALMLDKNIAPSNPSLLFNTSRGWDYYSYALPLYLRAANQGHVDSRVRVGDYYFYGYVPLANFNGTVENISLSLSHEVAWYFKPNSHRVPSYEDALAHYSAAASGEFSHSSIAMYNLGYMYEFGFGVPQDYHLAKRWYDLSMSTNPSAFLPVQICLSIMNVKWAIQDLLQVFAPPPPAPQLHPPIPDGDDDDSQSSRINYFWRILEPLSFLFFCGSAIYLYSYRQRVLPQVDEIIRQARDHVSAVERQRVEMEEREPLLNDEVDLNGRDTREQGTEGH